MHPHDYTALAYFVIGGVMIAEAIFFHLSDSKKYISRLGKWMTNKPPETLVSLVITHVWLFALFIVSCAVDHMFVLKLAPEFESIVSIFTAIVVFFEWFVIRIAPYFGSKRS